MTVTHMIGPAVSVGPLIRQRCTWCGALLMAYDTDRLAVPAGQDPTPAMLPDGALVRMDGAHSWTADTEAVTLPDDACARIGDAEAARRRG